MNCCAVVTRLGERMVSMSSTLVETVSINYEDFNESFLTCGTCLCMYDGSEHTPKLLQCSHTVCLHCLTMIAASQTRDLGTFRCPICRELITVPRGGVAALPPSFLVNQLLDLMSRQRREVIPKCSQHINQELLFCETCDTVFCTLCTGGSHTDRATGSGESGAGEHTIIPFSIAIKRMSEILLYKANECIQKLTHAQEGVSKELHSLESAKEKCIEQINETFQELTGILDKRKQEIIAAVATSCQNKKKVLEEQHALIETEKSKVEHECDGLQYQVEVRNITQRISTLTEKLDSATMLGEPRENAFLTCEFKHNGSLSKLDEALSQLGRVRTSTTFPSLCTATLDSKNETVVCGLKTVIHLATVDYHGVPRQTGGDPVNIEVISVGNGLTNSDSPPLHSELVDRDNGMYDIIFRPLLPGRYVANISVLGRPIKDCPLIFNVTEHNNPVCIYGNRGVGKDEFLQPVAVAVNKDDGLIYVVDTGNSRIKVLNPELELVKHIENEGLEGRSCTGIATSRDGLVVVNWRSKMVTELTTTGQTLKKFSYNEFQEPIDIAVDNSYGHILVADNGRSCVFMFNSEGHLLKQIGKKGTFNSIASVTVGLQGEIIVADTRIQVFDAKGIFMEELYSEGKGKGRYGGIVIDSDNRILASRSEKNRNFLQILSLDGKTQASMIDSCDSRLKRPSGVAVTSDYHIIVVDLGNDCIKKYRYW